MGEVLGLTMNNDQYADVPDDLKWAIPLHEHLTSPAIQEWFKMRQVLSEHRVAYETANRQMKSKKHPRILARGF